MVPVSISFMGMMFLKVAAPFRNIIPINDIDTGTIRKGRVNDRIAESHRTLDAFSQLDDEFIQHIVRVEPDTGPECAENFMFYEYITESGAGNIFDVRVLYHRF